jgi:hypothetical protein
MKKINKIVTVDGVKYARYPVKTHFIQINEDFDKVVEKYVVPKIKPGDIVSISEKIVALSQGDVVYRKDLPIGFWAKFLSKFASTTEAGIGVAEPIKLQYAISKKGAPFVIWASFVHAVYRVFGYRGKFYEMVGQDVSGLDGFYGHVWAEYEDLGIELPKNPDKKCDHLLKKYGFSTIIVDANDFGVEIIGKSKDIKASNDELKKIIKDNPAGQDKELTPIIILRKV